jgi:transcriptional regulator with XRE-family HTH domain
MTDSHRKKELAAFLRSRRAKLQPSDVGLPQGVSRRRTPGLRREEVAQISGVGLTWYTWLEQGRDIPTSRQVIEALATALRLEPEDRAHLHVLASLPPPPPGETTDRVFAAVHRMLDQLVPNPAYVINERFDMLAWNAAQAALWVDPGTVREPDRNLIWLMFTDLPVRKLVCDWETSARHLLGRFRAGVGRHADDPNFADLAGRLRAASPEFAAWWEFYPVAEFDIAVNELDHPRIGRIDFDLLHMQVVEDPTLTVVVQTPHSPLDAERLVKLLDTDHSVGGRVARMDEPRATQLGAKKHQNGSGSVRSGLAP